MKLEPIDIERFQRKVLKADGCWGWRGSRTHNGYGEVRVRGIAVRAHRFAWIMHFGPIPDGLWVLHKCDVPSCTNPEHLFLGTRMDNSQDKLSKGREARGERHGRAKLTESQALEILAQTNSPNRPRGTLVKLARRYGISGATVLDIASGKRWKHLRRPSPSA
jgi:hypothetical protein